MPRTDLFTLSIGENRERYIFDLAPTWVGLELLKSPNNTQQEVAIDSVQGSTCLGIPTPTRFASKSSARRSRPEWKHLHLSDGVVEKRTGVGDGGIAVICFFKGVDSRASVSSDPRACRLDVASTYDRRFFTLNIGFPTRNILEHKMGCVLLQVYFPRSQTSHCTLLALVTAVDDTNKTKIGIGSFDILKIHNNRTPVGEAPRPYMCQRFYTLCVLRPFQGRV